MPGNPKDKPPTRQKLDISYAGLAENIENKPSTKKPEKYLMAGILVVILIVVGVLTLVATL